MLDVPESEFHARQSLAAICRLMARFGLDDLTSTHLSTVIPERSGHYLLNPYGVLMREVTASSLIEIGPQGEILGGRQALEVNRTAIVIHGAIHRARPEVNTAIHAHTGAGIAVGCLPDGLLPLSQWALKFYGLTAFHEYDGAARMGGLGEAIERDLGQAVVMFMRNHGTLAVGRSAAEAFIRLYYLEQACKAQLMLCGVREALLMPSPEVCLRASQEQNMGTMQADGTFLPNGAREWAALMRILEREEPDYRE